MKIGDFFPGRCRKADSAIAIFLALSILPDLTAAGQPRLLDTKITRGKTAAGFHYMTGGLVSDERRAMERRSGPYNLKLIFASGSTVFIPPVVLLIGDNQGRWVEKIAVRRPWFYIQLPAGGYTIMARIKNKLVLIRDVYLHERRRVTYFVR